MSPAPVALWFFPGLAGAPPRRHRGLQQPLSAVERAQLRSASAAAAAILGRPAEGWVVELGDGSAEVIVAPPPWHPTRPWIGATAPPQPAPAPAPPPGPVLVLQAPAGVPRPRRGRR